jgi:hypothetical protein
MAEATHMMYIKPGRIDLDRIGQEWLGISAGGVERALRQREQLPDDAVIDVVYDDLLAAPETVLRGVFDRLDLAWGAADDANLAKALDRSGHRPHVYSLERYGLTEAKVDEAFRSYKIPSSSLT